MMIKNMDMEHSNGLQERNILASGITGNSTGKEI